MIERSKSVSAELADYLDSHRFQITANWIEAVRIDPNIRASKKIPREQLSDHLPALFDNLIATLRNPSTPGLAAKIERDSTAHGINRREQGYTLQELLREFTQLRTSFIHYFLIFEELHPNFGAAARLSVRMLFHNFFDNVLRISTEQHTRDHQPATGG